MKKFISLPLEWLKLTNELAYGEVILLAYLYTLGGKQQDTWMTNEKIADILNCGVSTVKRWLSNLENMKLITRYYDTKYDKEIRFIKVNTDEIEAILSEKK